MTARTKTPVTRPPGLLLFSHGSVLCGAARTLQAHAAALGSMGRYSDTRIGFLNYTAPLFGESVDQMVAEGIGHIIIVPYFLVAGKFVTDDLPPHIDAARARHPHVRFTVAQPLLDLPEMADAILESASLAHPLADIAPTAHVALHDCELRPTCPLYDTPACPRREEAGL